MTIGNQRHSLEMFNFISIRLCRTDVQCSHEHREHANTASRYHTMPTRYTSVLYPTILYSLRMHTHTTHKHPVRMCRMCARCDVTHIKIHLRHLPLFRHLTFPFRICKTMQSVALYELVRLSVLEFICIGRRCRIVRGLPGLSSANSTYWTIE